MTNIYWTEMKKLHNLLTNAEIPHKVVSDIWGGFQIVYPNEKEWVCDVVCHKYSYGSEKGLLEMMGLCSEDEYNVVGYMKAEDCFHKISDHWNTNPNFRK